MKTKYNQEQKYKYIDFLEDLSKDYNIKEKEFFQNLVHFQSGDNLPFQRWYPYREGYSYKLVDYFIKKYNVSGPILDPFVGSGSSLLAGRLNGLKTYGIDVNPLALFISKVENTNYNLQDLNDINSSLIKLLKLTRDEQCRTTKFPLADRYFDTEILQSMLQVRDFIKLITNPKVKNVFFLSWLSILENISNVKKEGNGLKYKNRKRTKKGYITTPIDEWNNKRLPVNRFKYVLDLIRENIEKIKEDISRVTINAKEPTLFKGSSISKISKINECISMTIFSPPYVNFFDYFEIHKIELWLGEFIKSQEQLRKLKRTGFRSNPSSIANKSIENKNKDVKQLINQFNPKDLWSKSIPEVVAGYFDDKELLLKEIFRKTKVGGMVVIVVGNSAYGGVIVPTDLLIARIAERIGFNVKDFKVARHLTTSPQQRRFLESALSFMRESIIVLKKEK